MSLFADKEIDRRFSRTQWRMLFATMIGYTLFSIPRSTGSEYVPHRTRLLFYHQFD